MLIAMALSGCSLLDGPTQEPATDPETLGSSIEWHLSIINSSASNRTKASAAWNLSLAYARAVNPPDLDKSYRYMRMCADLKGEKSLSVEARERLMLLKNIIDLKTALASTQEQLYKTGKLKEDLEMQKRNLDEAIEKLEDLQMEHEIKRRAIK